MFCGATRLIGSYYTGAFREIDGMKPRVHRGNAFCGEGAMHLSNPFALLDDSRWGRTKMQTLDNGKKFGWTTEEFPYICMAYRYKIANVCPFILA